MKNRLVSNLIIFSVFLPCFLNCDRSPVASGTFSEENGPADLVEPLVDAANSRWFFFNSATRRIISDVNGKYCDMTGPERRIGQIPVDEKGIPRFNHYNSNSFWRAQWTLNTLWHLVYPQVTEEFVNSMLLMYEPLLLDLEATFRRLAPKHPLCHLKKRIPLPLVRILMQLSTLHAKIYRQ